MGGASTSWQGRAPGDPFVVSLSNNAAFPFGLAQGEREMTPHTLVLPSRGEEAGEDCYVLTSRDSQ